MDKRLASQQSYKALLTQAAMARARVEQMEARVQIAERDLERTRVTAPYAGSIIGSARRRCPAPTLDPGRTRAYRPTLMARVDGWIVGDCAAAGGATPTPDKPCRPRYRSAADAIQA
jgi:hypothetical protein